ncbi:hypothetical protein [Bathymodiolus platifrons methanotrophic gill symbiont]|uniref:hypothetical protein n=1 Tax=Bathymodiolus platifrons methanotrophic gill symbiont TaxID=113268 RepID=UPI001C8E8407|nr:hypothetical protein [Bathymodiolus platifrons methanotrophic gill symbiont]
MAISNGSTAIRDKILASLARYRALRIGKFPCAFWRLSSRPGLTAAANFLQGFSGHLQVDGYAGTMHWHQMTVSSSAVWRMRVVNSMKR